MPRNSISGPFMEENNRASESPAREALRNNLATDNADDSSSYSKWTLRGTMRRAFQATAQLLDGGGNKIRSETAGAEASQDEAKADPADSESTIEMSTPKRGTQHARNISSPKSAKSSLIGHFRRHSKRGSLGSVFTPAHLKGPGQVVGEDDVDRVEIKPLDSEKRSGFASALGSLRGLGRSKRNTQHEQAATPPPRRETPSPEEQPLPSSPINIPAPALPLELIPVSPSLLNSPEANRAQELMAMTDPSKVIHGDASAYHVQLPGRMSTVQWKDRQTHHPVRHARDLHLCSVDESGCEVADLPPTPMPGTSFAMEVNPWDGSGAPSVEVFERGIETNDGTTDEGGDLRIRVVRSLDALAEAWAAQDLAAETVEPLLEHSPEDSREVDNGTNAGEKGAIPDEHPKKSDGLPTALSGDTLVDLVDKKESKRLKLTRQLAKLQIPEAGHVDSHTGRWISDDPLGVAGLSKVQHSSSTETITLPFRPKPPNHSAVPSRYNAAPDLHHHQDGFLGSLCRWRTTVERQQYRVTGPSTEKNLSQLMALFHQSRVPLFLSQTTEQRIVERSELGAALDGDPLTEEEDPCCSGNDSSGVSENFDEADDAFDRFERRQAFLQAATTSNGEYIKLLQDHNACSLSKNEAKAGNAVSRLCQQVGFVPGVHGRDSALEFSGTFVAQHPQMDDPLPESMFTAEWLAGQAAAKVMPPIVDTGEKQDDTNTQVAVRDSDTTAVEYTNSNQDTDCVRKDSTIVCDGACDVNTNVSRSNNGIAGTTDKTRTGNAVAITARPRNILELSQPVIHQIAATDALDERNAEIHGGDLTTPGSEDPDSVIESEDTQSRPASPLETQNLFHESDDEEDASQHGGPLLPFSDTCVDILHPVTVSNDPKAMEIKEHKDAVLRSEHDVWQDPAVDAFLADTRRKIAATEGEEPELEAGSASVKVSRGSSEDTGSMITEPGTPSMGDKLAFELARSERNMRYNAIHGVSPLLALPSTPASAVPSPLRPKARFATEETSTENSSHTKQHITRPVLGDIAPNRKAAKDLQRSDSGADFSHYPQHNYAALRATVVAPQLPAEPPKGITLINRNELRELQAIRKDRHKWLKDRAKAKKAARETKLEVRLSCSTADSPISPLNLSDPASEDVMMNNMMRNGAQTGFEVGGSHTSQKQSHAGCDEMFEAIEASSIDGSAPSSPAFSPLMPPADPAKNKFAILSSTDGLNEIFVPATPEPGLSNDAPAVTSSETAFIVPTDAVDASMPVLDNARIVATKENVSTKRINRYHTSSDAT